MFVFRVNTRVSIDPRVAFGHLSILELGSAIFANARLRRCPNAPSVIRGVLRVAGIDRCNFGMPVCVDSTGWLSSLSKYIQNHKNTPETSYKDRTIPGITALCSLLRNLPSVLSLVFILSFISHTNSSVSLSCIVHFIGLTYTSTPDIQLYFTE